LARTVDRPIRLYVLTILIVAAFGILPFVSAFVMDNGEIWSVGHGYLPFDGSIFVLYGKDGNADFMSVFVSLFLCVFSAASAIWAFYGDWLARVSTLVFVTADVLWWIGLTAYAIAMANTFTDKASLVLEVVVPLVSLGFIWWNFTRPDVNAYYKFKSECER